MAHRLRRSNSLWRALAPSSRTSVSSASAPSAVRMSASASVRMTDSPSCRSAAEPRTLTARAQLVSGGARTTTYVGNVCECVSVLTQDVWAEGQHAFGDRAHIGMYAYPLELLSRLLLRQACH